jgi:hypothetical protein
MLGCGSLGTLWLTYRNGKKGDARGMVVGAKLEELHKSTNGLSERAEQLARKLGVEEGTKVGLKEGQEERRVKERGPTGTPL